MQLQWIIVVLVIVSISCTTSSSTSTSNNTSSNSSNSSNIRSPPATVADVDNRDIKRLWAAALQAINEAELQRRTPSIPTDSVVAPQRINSKRLSWRPNSKLLNVRPLHEREERKRLERELKELDPLEARQNTFSWSQEEDINPDYVDVRDHTPKPAIWWF